MRQFDNDELRRRVDEVLFYVWDPIGVSDEPCARAEYESYVPVILKLVEENRSIKTISDHLATIVRVNMGLSPSKERCDNTAEILLRHKEAIEQGLA
ncbi:MAG TPA: hypothetical protein VJ373_01515 [Desulfatiglandales bacterium]|nr:hypothetical protein [Desulfatiglandales bacterium]